MMKNTHEILSRMALALIFLPGVSWAQVPYDPPTAQRAAPNVILLMDATRTTLINGSTCRGECHVEDGGNGGEHDPNIYNYGETRLQLARRVLTGGWGWNTTGQERPPGTRSADASVRRDGVMDQYFVRWGLIYYDGLGARLVLNPTLDNALAQQRVIDFGQPNFGETISNPAINPPLHSFLPYWRTTQCCGNAQQLLPWNDGWAASTPVWGEATAWAGRMTRALDYVHDYLDSNTAVYPQWAPGPMALGAFGLPPGVPQGNFFRGDDSNVLRNNEAAGGCRRNFVIQLTDGHGENNYGGQSRGQVAANIFNMRRNDGTIIPPHLANQLFTIHFGVAEDTYDYASTVADCGFDGVCGNGPTAFAGAPGGQISDLTPMYAAFTAIFQLVLDGTYLASPPTITRSGDREVTSSFVIQDCQGALPNQCNIGRIGNLRMDEVIYPTPTSLGVVDDTINFSEILRHNSWTNRNVFTSVNANGTNCGLAASCGVPAGSRAEWVPVAVGTPPGNNPGPVLPPSVGSALTDAEFLRGAPGARFANGVMRSDTSNGDPAIPSVIGRNPYKLMDIANSQSVVVGAPTGIGEDLERWEHYLQMDIVRDSALMGPGNTGWIAKGTGSTTIQNRDQVVYIGGNDGLIHAFLAGVADAGNAGAGRTASYPVTAGSICTTPGAVGADFPVQRDYSGCLGVELWAYSPRLVQPMWPSLRSGHYFMVDGTPVVSDVLFTKRSATPGPVCESDDGLRATACNNRWEYRTVLLQCLGGGGSGCFALDVSNPYRPELLWERSLTTSPVVTTRGTSTSRPQIVRVRRRITAGGPIIPYYVGIMGGGLGEAAGGNRRGSIIAMGLEDGDWYSSVTAELGDADFAGAPTCLDADGDSYTDTCYIATTRGDVYKARIGVLMPGNQGTSNQVTTERFFDGTQRLLDIGVGSTVANAIRSYGRVVATFDRQRDIRIYFATGDFENMQNHQEQNYLFELVDRTPEAALTGWTPALNTARAGGTCSAGPSAGVVPLPFGEKSVFDPVISNGVVLFTSYRPDANPCLVGRGYLNGVSVDDCGDGIDTDGDPNHSPDTGAPGSASRPDFEGLPVAPVVNERTGGITVATDRGGAQNNQGFTRRLPAPPVTKLWWRLVH